MTEEEFQLIPDPLSKKEVRTIDVDGCDATTRVVFEATHEEWETLARFFSYVNAEAKGNCQPTIEEKKR